MKCFLRFVPPSNWQFFYHRWWAGQSSLGPTLFWLRIPKIFNSPLAFSDLRKGIWYLKACLTSFPMMQFVLQKTSNKTVLPENEGSAQMLKANHKQLLLFHSAEETGHIFTNKNLEPNETLTHSTICQLQNLLPYPAFMLHYCGSDSKSTLFKSTLQNITFPADTVIKMTVHSNITALMSLQTIWNNSSESQNYLYSS